MAGVDLSKINRNDQGILAAGIVAFIASFLPFRGGTFAVLGVKVSGSENAWHSYTILGILLIFIAVGYVAARVFAGVKLPELPLGENLLVAAVAGIGEILLIIRALTTDGGSGPGYSYGVMWGGIVLMIAGAAVVAFAAMAFRESGEKLAWTPPAAGAARSSAAAGSSVPPAGNYGLDDAPSRTVPPQSAAPAADAGEQPPAQV